MSKDIIRKYIVAFAAFYIFWLVVLPFALSKTLSVVCRNISHNSDYEIVVENPKFKFYLLPNAKFKSSKISFKSKKDLTSVDISDFSVKLRLLPLLSGKLHINKVYCNKFFLTSELNKNIELDKNFLDKLEKTRVICDSITVDEFKTNIYAKDANTPIIYEGEKLLFQKKNRYIKANINSTLTVDKKDSRIAFSLYIPKTNALKKAVFDVDISNLDISPLRIYLKNFLPKDLKSMRGIINISANRGNLFVELKNTAAIMQEEYQSIVFPDIMTIKSKFSISQDLIEIANAEMLSDRIHLFVNGKIKDYFGKTMPTVDLNIVVNKSKVEDFTGFLPCFRVEEFDTYALKKYKFYGDVLGNMTVKGRLPEPEIYGNVFVDNGILIKPIPNTTKGATVKLKFTGKYANYDVYVPAGGAEKVWVKGAQEIYNIKYADMTVKSTKNVNLHSAQVVVNPLHEILNFVIGPVPILDVYGTGNIDITVKGNRKNPHVWGDLNFYDAQVNFLQIPDLILKNTNAILTFNDKNAVFKTNKAQLNSKDFQLSGICDLSGKFDFDAITANQPTAALYKAMQTSTMIPDLEKIIPKVDKIIGVTDLNLKIYGVIKDISDLEFNKNAFAKGNIVIKNNDIGIQGIDVQKANAKINLDSLNADAVITAFIGEYPLDIKAKIKNLVGDIDVNIPKINPNFMISDVGIRNKQYLPYVSVKAKYKGKVDDIEYDKLNFNSKILESNPNGKLKFNTGEVSLQNNKLSLKNIDGYIIDKQNMFKTDMRIESAFSNEPLLTGIFKLRTPNLAILNDIFAENILPINIKNYLKDIEFKKGAVNINGKVVDNKLTMDSDLTGISFNYLPEELPVDIMNGKISIRNNNIRLNKINILADGMPILTDGEIKDFSDKQNFDIYFNTKPKQEFIDKYINKKLIYPVKIKGDIVSSLTLKGIPSSYDIKAKVDMSKDSSIYHYGATIGDIENGISMDLDAHILNGKNFRIREFVQNKIIDSLSGRQTRLNMVKAWGNLDLLENNDIGFKDFRLKTSNPADARIFNIIFGKPNIKQGQYTADLKFNGKLSAPKILGDFHIFETNIPFLDTTMKNIVFRFKDKTIELESKGEVLGNDISADAVIKNKLLKPYHILSANIYTKDMNLNHIVSRLKESAVEETNGLETFDGLGVNTFIADNLKIKADNVLLRNIHATNFEAETSLNSKKVFDIKRFVFNIAKGQLQGNYRYNLNNDDLNLNMTADSISANDITWALFNLNNQIHGAMTGNIDLACNGKSFESCMQSLNGTTRFTVKDGRMPKLGSLEYLLKAGNLVKGGITGVSINSVIDLVTPLKTGEFSEIYGSINIKDGLADNIEITTKGKDLSLFITGVYNFATGNAEMEVLGLLSRKISNLLGPIGNASINTLFNLIPGVDLSKDSSLLDKINKVPGLEISDKAYRKLVAEIKGNINGENYVSSFKWIN